MFTFYFYPRGGICERDCQVLQHGPLRHPEATRQVGNRRCARELYGGQDQAISLQPEIRLLEGIERPSGESDDLLSGQRAGASPHRAPAPQAKRQTTVKPVASMTRL